MRTDLRAELSRLVAHLTSMNTKPMEIEHQPQQSTRQSFEIAVCAISATHPRRTGAKAIVLGSIHSVGAKFAKKLTTSNL